MHTLPIHTTREGVAFPKKNKKLAFGSLQTFYRQYNTQKSQGHEILALGLIWANLKHDEARFSKF